MAEVGELCVSMHVEKVDREKESKKKKKHKGS